MQRLRLRCHPSLEPGLLRRAAPRKDGAEDLIANTAIYIIKNLRKNISRHCERSEATQSSPARSLDCFVAQLLARTNGGADSEYCYLHYGSLRKNISRHCERSEATQSSPARSLDCFVAQLLARTNGGADSEYCYLHYGSLRKNISRHCERSEATQSSPARSLGCFVAQLLARTERRS